MKRNKKKLKAKIHKLKDITPQDIISMHNVFKKYYHNCDFDTFKKDLNKKNAAILVRRKDNNNIVGFTTVMKFEINVNNKKSYAFFSGDTIIEQEFWGSTALHFAAIRHAIIEKIKSFGTPLYWFLITKGYKTYLLLANNLTSYYPRYDKPFDPQMKSVLDACCMKIYPENYNRKAGLLEFGDNYQKLKSGVAPISKKLKTKYPKIAYFEYVNPNWRDGVELPTIGKVTLPMIIAKSGKFAFKIIKKSIKKSKITKTTRTLSKASALNYS